MHEGKKNWYKNGLKLSRNQKLKMFHENGAKPREESLLIVPYRQWMLIKNKNNLWKKLLEKAKYLQQKFSQNVFFFRFYIVWHIYL